MKYRARLMEPETKRERPLEILSHSYDDIAAWVEKVLAAAPDGSFVNVYETRETRIAILHKPVPKEVEAK